MNDLNGKKPDPRPKRRKLRDNPYSIFTIGIHTDAPEFYISFSDSEHRTHCIEISRDLFEAFDEFERSDLSYLNEVDRHYELSEQSEENLVKRAVLHQVPVEEYVQQRMEAASLHKAIALLPEIQRRRLVLYYFEDLSYTEIAKMEGCSHVAVRKSIYLALKSLKHLLSD